MNDTENEITQLQDYITSYALDNDITISCKEVAPRKTYTPVDENVWKSRIEAVRSKYGFVDGFNYDH